MSSAGGGGKSASSTESKLEALRRLGAGGGWGENEPTEARTWKQYFSGEPDPDVAELASLRLEAATLRHEVADKNYKISVLNLEVATLKQEVVRLNGEVAGLEAARTSVNEEPLQGEPPIGVVRTYISKVKDDLWALFELLPRTGSNVWRLDAAKELRDWKPDGFLDLLMRCVRMFFHFDGTRWQPSLLIANYDTLTVVRLIDDPSRGMRRYLKKIQDRNLTSEVSHDIRTKYDTWSAYVLSFLDDNRAYLTRLHAEAEAYRKGNM
jgi:hypothetical protein